MILPLVLFFATRKATQKPVRQVVDIEIEPNDKWLAVSAATDDVWIYRISDGKLLRTLHHKPGSHLVDIEISPDKGHIVCSNVSYEGDYTPVWSTKSWHEVAKIGIPMTKSFWDTPGNLEYAAGGKYLIGPTLFGHELVVWNAQTGAVAYIARKNSRFGSVAFAVNANSTFVAMYDPQAGRIRFWNFENTSKVREWGDSIKNITNRGVTMMRFSHDDRRLFVISHPPQQPCTFDVCEPVRGATVIAQSDRISGLDVRDLSWAADDSMIYMAGLFGRIVCFNPKSGTVQKSWIGHSGKAIRAVAALHHGPEFVTGAADAICIWSGVSGKLVRTIQLPR